MRRITILVLVGLLTALLAMPLASAAAAAPVTTAASGTTIVSLTFDDGWRSQLAAVRSMARHRMHGTFYITDGSVGDRSYLSWREIRSLASAGHEIGGHTVDHPHLSELGREDQREQICVNRERLLERGFEVTSFAYPFGEADPPLGTIVKECGYNSGRDTSGLVDRDSCHECPLANPLPVPDPYRIRVSSAVTTPENLRAYVRQASREKGRTFVPLVSHHICDPGCKGRDTEERISAGEFDAFLTGWRSSPPSR
jgi:peptidoglycan/xylan/chitin deacetylase (PgdA/CDA1 family)